MGRYWRTIRHLTARQLVFQVWNRLRGRPRLRWRNQPEYNVPEVPLPITFTFLNQSVTFDRAIDWNYAANGKLWTYNLNYFAFLDEVAGPDGLALMHDFIRQTRQLRDGLEPYPTSLRVLHWRRFLEQHQLCDPLIDQHLYAQTALLASRLEYHLGGNHLLENACALLIMAVHFRQQIWFRKAANLLRAELNEQILSDGGHYERSPVYHQLLTDRLLDVYETRHAQLYRADTTLIDLVKEKVCLMLGWLEAITFRNGDVPMVNDSAYGVAPSTAQLCQRATYLNLQATPVALGESGYRMLTTPRLECFIDIGPVGPDHQPGHAHADTFSWVLYADNQPVIVDPGTSTYLIGPRRDWERSTEAHNTVTVAGQNSSEVWGGFRVGRRATVEVLTDTPTQVVARHDGYKNTLGTWHWRTWHLLDENTLAITDRIDAQKFMTYQRFYFDKVINLVLLDNGIQTEQLRLNVFTESNYELRKSTYERVVGFNRCQAASCLTIRFDQSITTTIRIVP
ncbi:heparinase II/III family protein [Fibrella sp. WM1]|uniref:heparinase II/III domain-containing protein n=1 Tax=Fibrella musci TaxID=3242485 RepID=UPI003521167F